MPWCLSWLPYMVIDIIHNTSVVMISHLVSVVMLFKDFTMKLCKCGFYLKCNESQSCGKCFKWLKNHKRFFRAWNVAMCRYMESFCELHRNVWSPEALFLYEECNITFSTLCGLFPSVWVICSLLSVTYNSVISMLDCVCQHGRVVHMKPYDSLSVLKVTRVEVVVFLGLSTVEFSLRLLCVY